MGRPKNNQKRQLKINILVCCEGKTEENYMNFVVKKHLSNTNKKIKLNIKKFKSVDEAKRFRIRASEIYDWVFFLFDLDECSNDQNKIVGFTKREQDCKREGTNWKCFYTYPCMELWYLLHFKSHTAPLGSSTEVISKLRGVGIWPSYEKPMPTTPAEASDLLGKITTAIQHEKLIPTTTPLSFSGAITSGRNILTNPMSSIGKMIEALLVI